MLHMLVQIVVMMSRVEGRNAMADRSDSVVAEISDRTVSLRPRFHGPFLKLPENTL